MLKKTPMTSPIVKSVLFLFIGKVALVMIFGIFDQHLRIKQALFLTFDNELKIALVVVQAKLLSKCTIRT